jgi:hypothetical protein
VPLPAAESSGYLEHAMEEMNFRARAHDRILKVVPSLNEESARHSGAAWDATNTTRS